jgi:hypothetical protein
MTGVTKQAFARRDVWVGLLYRLTQFVTIATDGRLGFRQQCKLIFLMENVARQTLVVHHRLVRHRRNRDYHVFVTLPATDRHDPVLELAGVRLVTQRALLRLLGMGAKGYALLGVVGVASCTQLRLGLSQDGRLLAAMASMTQQTLLRGNGGVRLFRYLVVAVPAHLRLRRF